ALLIVTVALLWAFFTTAQHDPPRIESHWGGLGGSLGGWHMSASMAYLLAAVAFGAMFTTVVAKIPASEGTPPATVTVDATETARISKTVVTPTATPGK